jgi:hypothetical protein
MRICYVGHKFHNKTRSTQFFLDIIKTLGSVEEFFSSPDEPDSADDALIATLATSTFDCYIFLQTEYIAERLLPFGLGRFILVPMYDGAKGRPPRFWRQFLDAQFISFSRVHHEELQRLDCKTAYFQYFPKPGLTAAYDFAQPHSAFFWERLPGRQPTLQTILRLCNELGIKTLHLHAAPDFVGHGGRRLTGPEASEMDGVQVTASSWFESAADLHAVAERAHFMFASRPLEGIGMSFLEAMARGQIVIAPNGPTMNEYIRHRTTGILYDFGRLKMNWQPTFDELNAISCAAVHKAADGFEEWSLDQERLKSLIVNDGRRWSTMDVSSHFKNEIRRRASRRARSL